MEGIIEPIGEEFVFYDEISNNILPQCSSAFHCNRRIRSNTTLEEYKI